MPYFSLLVIISCFLLSSCGTVTGIPGHGGGKRFAVEQELVSASVRASLKAVDVSSLQGKGVTLYINAIGDQGVGNFIGGKYSLTTLLRGDSISGVPSYDTSDYSTVTTQSTSTNRGSNSYDDSSTTNTTVSTVEQIPVFPTSKKTVQDGTGRILQAGIAYKGIGAYSNSDRVVPKDIQFFSAAIQTYLFLKNVHVVPPSEAEIDLYITIDVFGTERSRIEWFIANNEVLKAKTALEIMGVNRLTGTIIMQPQVSSYEAEYNEQYILWIGPVETTKTLRKSDGLLCDYTDVNEEEKDVLPYEVSVPVSYPFKKYLD